MDLPGRVALLTGTKRIGAVVAIELARRGADVGLVYFSSRAECDEAAAAIRALGRRAAVLQANLRDPEACRRVADETVTAFGRLDVLINMASVYRRRPFDETTDEDWSEAIEVDLRSAWLCARAAVPHMRRAGGGRIINFSDWIARSGRPRYPGYLPYYVAKGAMALTRI